MNRKAMIVLLFSVAAGGYFLSCSQSRGSSGKEEKPQIQVQNQEAAVTGNSAVKESNGDYSIASIGEEKIYFSQIQKLADSLNRFLKENFQTSKEWRVNYIQQYIARAALCKRAEKEGLDKDSQVIFALEQARESILSDKILMNELDKIKITDEDYKNYYEQNKARYQVKEKVKISYVKAKDKKEADDLSVRINKGISFAKLGKKVTKISNWVSRDAPLMEQGLENLSAEVLNSLVGLGAGGSSQPVVSNESGVMSNELTQNSKLKTQNFYIFHIDEKEAAQDKLFEEVRKQVEFEYAKEKKDKIINDFIMDTFRNEKVEIYNDAINKNFNK